jgi:hypothetical protein
MMVRHLTAVPHHSSPLGVERSFGGSGSDWRVQEPSSHREVEHDDPTFASEVVLFADLMLRMLDRVADRV